MRFLVQKGAGLETSDFLDELKIQVIYKLGASPSAPVMSGHFVLPLPRGAGLGSLSSTPVKYLGSDGEVG